jgi:Subtilase family
MSTPCSSRPVRAVAALLLSCGLAACKGDKGDAPVDPPPVTPPVDLPADPPDAADRQFLTRWIAEAATPGTCIPEGVALTAGWTVAPLHLEDIVAATPSKFCVFEFAGTVSDVDKAREELLDNPVAAAALKAETLVPDQAIVLSMADLESYVTDDFAAQFWERTGRLAYTSTEGVGRTRLSILDTAPTATNWMSDPTGGLDRHGAALAGLARDLACATSFGADGQKGPEWGSCPVQIATRLALGLARRPSAASTDRRADQRLEWSDGGGNVSTLSRLAAALHAEVRSWKEASPDGPNHLVINLSLGWLGTRGGNAMTIGGREAPDDAGARAVYEAIVEARCAGAIVVAASGNLVGGDLTNEGPLLPAAWGNHQIGDACVGKASSTEGSEPLLWAVGGLGANDGDLANSQPGANPPLLAPADHYVDVDAPAGERLTYTGTSVAAAVVSASAAALWSADPKATGAQVMANLHTQGKAPANVAVSSAFNKTGKAAVRVDACAAAQAAAATLSCSRATAPTELPTHLESFLAQKDINNQPLVPDVTISAIGTPQPAPGCATEVVYPEPPAASKSLACPEATLGTANQSPWVQPQPNQPGCPFCLVTSFGNGLTTVVIDEITASISVTTPDLALQTNGTSGTPNGWGHFLLDALVPDPVSGKLKMNLAVPFTAVTAARLNTVYQDPVTKALIAQNAPLAVVPPL